MTLNDVGDGFSHLQYTYGNVVTNQYTLWLLWSYIRSAARLEGHICSPAGRVKCGLLIVVGQNIDHASKIDADCILTPVMTYSIINPLTLRSDVRR